MAKLFLLLILTSVARNDGFRVKTKKHRIDAKSHEADVAPATVRGKGALQLVLADAPNGHGPDRPVFETGGVPKYTDVSQGSLGDCYFLATLAAIAHTHPNIIQDMFIDRSLWKAPHPVYRTRWLLDGQERSVSVDGFVPSEGTKIKFVRVNDGNDFWPVLLEKAWAKIHGSYAEVIGGDPSEVIKAITQAPVESFKISESSEADTWHRLTEALTAGYAVLGASLTKDAPFNVVSRHSFAILGADNNYLNKYGPAVHMLNPWGTKHEYCGKIEQETLDTGDFWIGFDEFLQAFGELWIGKIEEGYGVSSQPMRPSSAGTFTDHFEMQVNTDKPFSLLLQWPSKRLSHGCTVTEPTAAIGVYKDGNTIWLDTSEGGAHKKDRYAHNYRMDLQGAGTYTVFVHAYFGNSNGGWLQEIVLNTYAANEAVAIQPLDGSPWDTFLMMKQLCKTVILEGQRGVYTWDERQTIKSFPTFFNNAPPQLKVIHYSPLRYWLPETGDGKLQVLSGDGQWQVSASKADAEAGSIFSAGQPKCVQGSLLQNRSESSILQTEDERYATEEAAQPVQFELPELFNDGNSSMMEVGGTCADVAEEVARRIANLDRFSEISRADPTDQAADVLFPGGVKSIGNVQSARPAAFTNWHRIVDIEATMAAEAAAMTEAKSIAKNCVDAWIQSNGACAFRNKCKHEIQFTLRSKIRNTNCGMVNMPPADPRIGDSSFGGDACCVGFFEMGVHVENLQPPRTGGKGNCHR